MDFPAPISDDAYRATDPEVVALGRLLFWDPILSGNRNISCGTCHHPRFGTGDGLSLGLGEGGTGLGPERAIDPENPPEQRIPRNAPALFNLGAHEFTVLFHDGRIEETEDGLRTPMGDEMEQGFATLLSAQTMFPVLSADEMAGHYGENEISKAVRQGLITGEGGAWDLLSARVRAIPVYVEMFEAAMPGREIGFTAISDAIAQFVEHEWRSDTAPFDAWLRGEGALPDDALTGLELFYGAAGCAECHSGPFQTDHAFHAMGQPQLGPGKAARFETHARDDGRMRVTGAAADAYAFRTPSLRNATETGPWGHAGAYADLAAFLRDHAAPRAALASYQRDVVLPALEAEDWRVMDDPAQVTAIAAAVQGPDRILTDAEIASLMAFLAMLTDQTALAGRLGIPETVPSGLPVDR
ncbi:cytochrome c peroxidase [Jannaschia seohaensis]|uniref:Cytochrome c peroxidase n=2 Tax=Jannaschia seohaensis TaxID=475081 RepID=A0A2Y9A770_9RHOB|nr:cytochrome c peroxidase [Jannaschia seohaensis]SSA38439.1 cytochrome c peroxidase [Jannaschia seohaensis]